MPYYMVQASISAKTWNVLIRNPHNRIEEAIRPVIENLGGKVLCSFLSFGDYDSVTIVDMPDNLSTAAINMAVMAGGALKSLSTTVLITWEEGIEAMRKARKATYKPPNTQPMIDRTE